MPSCPLTQYLPSTLPTRPGEGLPFNTAQPQHRNPDTLWTAQEQGTPPPFTLRLPKSHRSYDRHDIKSWKAGYSCYAHLVSGVLHATLCIWWICRNSSCETAKAWTTALKSAVHPTPIALHHISPLSSDKKITQDVSDSGGRTRTHILTLRTTSPLCRVIWIPQSLCHVKAQSTMCHSKELL